MQSEDETRNRPMLTMKQRMRRVNAGTQGSGHTSDDHHNLPTGQAVVAAKGKRT